MMLMVDRLVDLQRGTFTDLLLARKPNRLLFFRFLHGIVAAGNDMRDCLMTLDSAHFTYEAVVVAGPEVVLAPAAENREPPEAKVSPGTVPPPVLEGGMEPEDELEG